MVHILNMEGHELLRLLLEKRGMNPNSLANALRNRSIQSQVQRYLDKKTKNPRLDTLQPIAKFFGIGVEAFYQPAIAKGIAERLQLIQPGTGHIVSSGEPPENHPHRHRPARN